MGARGAFPLAILLGACATKPNGVAVSPQTTGAPSPGGSRTTQAEPSASPHRSELVASPPTACPEDPDPCGQACVSVAGKAVEIPSTAAGFATLTDPEDGWEPWMTYTIKLFDHGEASCDRLDYTSMVSLGGFDIGTISWGGWVTGRQGAVMLASDLGGALELCVHRVEIDAPSSGVITVQGRFSAPLCPAKP